MIFATVGTHEQPFDRLIKALDDLVCQGKIQEEVLIQTGFSTYEPKYCQWSRMLPLHEMQASVQKARIVITHGGPASFMLPLQMGKIPVVVPRQARFGEHVNDHQVDFVRQLSERTDLILPVYEIETLGNVILGFEKTAAKGVKTIHSHNEAFNQALEQIILELMEMPK